MLLLLRHMVAAAAATFSGPGARPSVYYYCYSDGGPSCAPGPALTLAETTAAEAADCEGAETEGETNDIIQPPTVSLQPE